MALTTFFSFQFYLYVIYVFIIYQIFMNKMFFIYIAGQKVTIFRQRSLWVLKISILSLNSPQIGGFQPKFSLLDDNFLTRKTLSVNFPTALPRRHCYTTRERQNKLKIKIHCICRQIFNIRLPFEVKIGLPVIPFDRLMSKTDCC